MESKIKFPLLELTDWGFEGERVFEMDREWPTNHKITKYDIERHYKRVIIDADGQVLKVVGDLEVPVNIKKTWFSSLFAQYIEAKFNIEPTGKTMSLDEVKKHIISKAPENFILKNRSAAETDIYISKVKAATNYERLFIVASFEDE